MQELFVDKIHFFKFLSMSDKLRLHQLKIVTSTRSTAQVFLTALKEGETPYVEKKYKASPTYQAHWNFLFHSLTYISQIFVQYLPEWSKPSTSKLRQSEYFKKYEPCQSNISCWESAF